MVALILFNLALRSRNLAQGLGWLALAMPLFLHQFLSFGRGMWLGNISGVIASILIFSWRGRSGIGPKGAWKRSLVLVSVLVGVGISGAVALAVLYGNTDILLEAGTRFTSIGQTELHEESRANVARLMEYGIVLTHIQKQPWFGHGLGYSFRIPNIFEKLEPQYWVHENYLLVWLKQGLLGLLLFVWMLWSAARLGIHHARRRADPIEASWLAAAGAGTILISVFALTDFPFDSVEPMFLVALLWGGAMALTRDGFFRFRWRPEDPAPEPDPAPAPGKHIEAEPALEPVPVE
jgi:O-antigen ligase